MVSGGSSDSRSSSRTAPWAAQQPFLKDIYSRAEALYEEGPYEYGPDRVAGFNPTQERALGMAAQRGGAGSDLTRAAQAETTSTLRGDYLNPESNPHLQRFAEIGERNIRRGFQNSLSGLGSSYEGAGRAGSGNMLARADIMREGLATGLGDFNAQLYGGAYEGERNRMMGAAGMSNDLANQDYRDLSAMMSAGSMRQQQSQKALDDVVEHFLFRQGANADKLAEFSTMIGQPVSSSYAKSKSDSWNFGILG